MKRRQIRFHSFGLVLKKNVFNFVSSNCTEPFESVWILFYIKRNYRIQLFTSIVEIFLIFFNFIFRFGWFFIAIESDLNFNFTGVAQEATNQNEHIVIACTKTMAKAHTKKHSDNKTIGNIFLFHLLRSSVFLLLLLS